MNLATIQPTRAKVSEGPFGVSVTTFPGTQKAGILDIEIQQGATWSLPLFWYDGQNAELIDVSGYTARLKIRESWDSTTILLSLTNSSGITLAATGPNITITATATVTAALDFTQGVYDLELVSGSTVTRLLQGTVRLRTEATY